MSRSRGYYRAMRKKAIQKKKCFLKRSMRGNMPHYLDTNDIFNTDACLTSSFGVYWHVKNEGELNKGKIHCSCGICSYHGVPMQDKRTLMRLEDELNDLDNVSSDVVNVAKNKIGKLKRGRYYPNSGIKGSSVQRKSKTNKDEFDRFIKERNQNFIMNHAHMLVAINLKK